jgi:hypothetical protein
MNTDANTLEISLGVESLRLCVFALNAALQPVVRLALGPEPAPSSLFASSDCPFLTSFNLLQALAAFYNILGGLQRPVKSVNKW